MANRKRIFKRIRLKARLTRGISRSSRRWMMASRLQKKSLKAEKSTNAECNR